jgi:hypothetical protein
MVRHGAGMQAATPPSAWVLVGFFGVAVAMVLALAVAIVPAAEMPAAAAPAATPATAPAAAPVDSFAVTDDPSLEFVLEAGNRLYPDWKETRRVKLHERFLIGDTENEAEVVRLLPDFLFVEGKPASVSKFLNNPAVRMRVYKGEAAIDSSWAFLNFPPHFSPRSFYTFQLKEIVGYRFGPQEVRAPAPAAAAAARDEDRPKQAKKAAHPGGTSSSKED